MHALKQITLAALLAMPLTLAAVEPSDRPALATHVNINTADASTLAEMLDGVGDARARAIVEYRAANGPFTSADQLAEVKGIGDAVVEKNRERIRVK